MNEMTRAERNRIIVSSVIIAISVCIIAVVAFLMLSRGPSSQAQSSDSDSGSASASLAAESESSASGEGSSSDAAGESAGGSLSEESASGASDSALSASPASEEALASGEPGTSGEAGDAAADAAPPADQGVAAEGTSVAAQSAPDLSWRDADFAVDPNRREWSTSENGRKVVYLTFDDGPSERTGEVLDVLDAYGCKATFFVIDTNSDYYPMIKEAYDRGHTIGLHSLTHDYAYVYSSVQAFYDDLDGIGSIVRDQIGYVPCFIRFPGGSSNEISANFTKGIMTTLVDDVQARGYQYYDWNVSIGDAAEYTVDELVQNATVNADPFDNILLLMHDSAPRQTTVEALPRIIEYYQARGYTFEAIDRTVMPVHHGVRN